MPMQKKGNESAMWCYELMCTANKINNISSNLCCVWRMCSFRRKRKCLALAQHLSLYTHWKFLFTFLQRDCRWGFLMKFRALVCAIRMCFDSAKCHVCVRAQQRESMCLWFFFNWFKVDRNWKCSMRGDTYLVRQIEWERTIDTPKRQFVHVKTSKVNADTNFVNAKRRSMFFILFILCIYTEMPQCVVCLSFLFVCQKELSI